MLYGKVKKYLSDNSINIDKVNGYFELSDNGEGAVISYWDESSIGVVKPSNSILNGITENESLIENIVPLIKAEASTRIDEAYPEWQQRNYMAAVAEIHNKEIMAMKAIPFIAQYTLTADELQTMRDADACKKAITAIRTKSNQLETSLDTMTLDQLKAFDPTDDSNWT